MGSIPSGRTVGECSFPDLKWRTTVAVFNVSSIENPRDIVPHLFRDSDGERLMTDKEARHILEICQAFWLHSGNARQPHAELTSGKCSNGYVNCRDAFSYPNVCALMGRQLGHLFRTYKDSHNDLPWPTWCVSSAYTGIRLADRVAEHAAIARAGHTEKAGKGFQVWTGPTIGPDDWVLQIEDVKTTGGTIEATRDAIQAAHEYPILFLPVVPLLIDRSTTPETDDRVILPLVRFDIWSLPPAECPLCAQGSKRLKPKANWAELTAQQ